MSTAHRSCASMEPFLPLARGDASCVRSLLRISIQYPLIPFRRKPRVDCEFCSCNLAGGVATKPSLRLFPGSRSFSFCHRFHVEDWVPYFVFREVRMVPEVFSSLLGDTVCCGKVVMMPRTNCIQRPCCPNYCCCHSFSSALLLLRQSPTWLRALPPCGGKVPVLLLLSNTGIVYMYYPGT